MNDRNEAGVASRSVLIALLGVAVVAVCGFGLIRLSDRQADPVNTVQDGGTATTATSTTTATTATSATPSASISPEQIVRPKCVGPSDVTNLSGLEADTLPADCGNTPVPATSKQPLGLACGGKYPVIMFKTTTASSRTSICGVNSSGEFNYMVTKPNGGTAVGMKAQYDPDLDAFVASKDGVKYIVEAYNGSLTVKKTGSTEREVSKDWISLDNESDYD